MVRFKHKQEFNLCFKISYTHTLKVNLCITLKNFLHETMFHIEEFSTYGVVLALKAF